MSRGSKDIARGGLARSVTVTFGYPDRMRSLVAGNLRLALLLAESRWGRWQTIESISTPNTIYADLTGLTRRRLQPGARLGGGDVGTARKLRTIGYQPTPEEIGTLSYYREELPRTYRHTRRPSKRVPGTARGDEFG